VRSDVNLNQKFAEEGVDPRQYASMPGVIDTSRKVEGEIVLRSHSFSGNERNSVFLNRGGKGFEDISGVTGIDSLADGRAFAFLDFDHDGRNDLVLTNTNNPQLQLFHNEIEDGGNSVAIRLVGGNRSSEASEEWSSRDAFGAHLLLEAGEMNLRRELRAGDGFAAQNSNTLTIGLGQAGEARKVVVIWPSGKRTEVGTLKAGKRVTLFENPEEGEAMIENLKAVALPEKRTKAPLNDRLDLPVGEELNVVVTLATWCPVCRGEVAHFKMLVEKGGDGIGYYAVPIDPADDGAKLAKFQKEMNPSYEILQDSTATQKEEVEDLMKKTFGEYPLPSTFILDRDGRVLDAMKGTPTLSQLRLLKRRVRD
jgi:peroxiredoxin